MNNNKRRSGFTLIELLVVIAIIAILAVVVVLTLNPAELLRQARDSNRISDFATIKSSIALYTEDVATTTTLCRAGTCPNLYTADGAAPAWGAVYTGTGANQWGFVGGETGITTTTTSHAVDGTGWLPVNLNAISSGAPISSWPVDPVNTATNTAYIYAATSTSPATWKIATMMESAKYHTGGTADVETGDGGASTYSYEQGSNVTGL
jgi:prepilin-type N-terminal cleavage/methylation domain-containing protein